MGKGKIKMDYSWWWLLHWKHGSYFWFKYLLHVSLMVSAPNSTWYLTHTEKILPIFVLYKAEYLFPFYKILLKWILVKSAWLLSLFSEVFDIYTRLGQPRLKKGKLLTQDATGKDLESSSHLSTVLMEHRNISNISEHR